MTYVRPRTNDASSAIESRRLGEIESKRAIGIALGIARTSDDDSN
jgi:hypothetical protein